MKISIPKSEIEKFLQLSSYVNVTSESVTYLPITEYIKFEINKGFCKLTLTSSSNFVSYMFSLASAEKIDMLVSIFEIKKFYSGPKRKDILTISENDKGIITLSDGSFTSKALKKSDLSPYPPIPSLSGLNLRRVNKKTIDQLFVSKKYILLETKDKLRPLFNNASILGNLLLSTDMIISCLYKLDEEFDFSFFSIKEIDLVSNFEYFDYSKLENWNIIKYKTIIYGNKYSEQIEPGSVHKAIQNSVDILNKTNFIRLNVEEFYDFCKSVKPYVVDSNINSYLEVIEDEEVNLVYEDIKNSIDVRVSMPAEIVGFESGYKIWFFQNLIIKVLDSLDSHVINISECVENLSGDVVRKNYIGFWLETDKDFHSICSKAPTNVTI